ncbi:hypothetical protein D8Y22_06595 [Salinadaptatus halalkaliphilus]|uniref:Uncharacterized protein n=1 Tax=Salinadaptatus halalkaliphilus TaxID=2419781 RepID=A0A4S3TSJ5_9EURY|nr:hypothetical protein [Salinadaptatus halalkaliphilus]THE65598.1 hypothetical protein D8Y22_06595 [Salinadaptatus halalkaliphilus]
MGLLDKITGALSDDESESDSSESTSDEQVNIERRTEIITEHYGEIDRNQAQRIADILKNTIDGDEKFTFDDIRNEIEESVGLSRDFAERIVQNEHTSIQMSRRFGDYKRQVEEMGLNGEYYVSAPTDDRSHPVEIEAVEETNPFEGGDPLPIDELHDLLKSKAEKYQDEGGTPERMDHWVPHEKPRLSIVRMPGS